MDWSRAGLIEWNNAYSVRMREIDDQHRTLIAQIRAFQEAMMGGRAKEALSDILSNLRTYARIHFAFEEKLMEEHEDPEIEAHKAAHEKLTQQVVEFQNKLNTGALVPSVQAMVFLRQLLIDHIAALDVRLGAHLNSKGVQ